MVGYTGEEGPLYPRRKRQMKSLHMFYEEDRELDRVLEEFSRKLQDLGAKVRPASFEDV